MYIDYTMDKKYLKYKKKYLQKKRGGSQFVLEETQPVPNTRIIQPAYNLVEMYYKPLGEYFSQAQSDHALIRYEFDSFVVYSWNILNHDDSIALRVTMKHFSALTALTDPSLRSATGEVQWSEEMKKDLMIGPFDPNYYQKLKDEKVEKFGLEIVKLLEEGRHIYLPVDDFYREFNNVKVRRLENILSLLRGEVAKETKPVIICLQEVSSTMYGAIASSFRETHTLHHSSTDIMNTFPPAEIKDFEKDETRVTLIPNTVTIDSVESYYYHNSPLFKEGVRRPVKPALLTSVIIDGVKYNIVNVHAFFMSQEVNLEEFLTSLPEGNTIVVGDFNRDVRQFIKKVPSLAGYSMLSPGPSFITKHINNSDELDHLLYRIH